MNRLLVALLFALLLIGCTKEVPIVPPPPPESPQIANNSFIESVQPLDSLKYDVTASGFIENIGTEDQAGSPVGWLKPLKDMSKPLFSAEGQMGLLDATTGYTTWRELRTVIRAGEILHFRVTVRLKWDGVTPYWFMFSWKDKRFKKTPMRIETLIFKPRQ